MIFFNCDSQKEGLYIPVQYSKKKKKFSAQFIKKTIFLSNVYVLF